MKAKLKLEYRIQELIRDMQWGPACIQKLAEEYDVTQDDVISARIRAVAELQATMAAARQDGTLKAEIVMQMRELSKRAMSRKRFAMTDDGPVEYEDPDIKSAVLALQSAADIAGVGKEDREEDEQLSSSELISRVVSVLGEKSNPPALAGKQEE